MSSRKPRLDVILFLSAFATVILGIGLLLHTTGLVRSILPPWPMVLFALGGLSLCLAFARSRGSAVAFGGGLYFIFMGVIILLASLAGWRVRNFWPFFMLAAGLSLLMSGIRTYRKAKASYIIPSLGFTFLGLFFSLFSFSIVSIGFGAFIRAWWPSIFIAAGIVLFVAYGGNRRGRLGPKGKPGEGGEDRGDFPEEL